MSGVGFSELVILFLIGLIVLGPERLPRVANQLGTWLGQARRMTRMMKRQLEEELDLEARPKPAQPPPMLATPRDDDHYSPLHDAAHVAGESPADESPNDAPEPADEKQERGA